MPAEETEKKSKNKIKVFAKKIDGYNSEKIEEFLKEVAEQTSLREKLTKSEKIVIKPNLLGAYSPEKAVTTHPVVIEAMIRILLSWNKKVYIADSPGGTVDVEKVWKITGMKDISEKYPVELVKLNGPVVEKKYKGYTLYIDKFIDESDCIINMCKYKTHSLMLYTGAVKNLFGVVPGLKKSQYHKEYPDPQIFGSMLSALYNTIKEKVVINIMDGILGMEGEGPSGGIPRKFGILLASENAPALDCKAAEFMGFRLAALPYLSKSMNSDNLSQDSIQIDTSFRDFKFNNVKIRGVKSIGKLIGIIPDFLINLFKKWFDIRPVFLNKCKLCGICVKSCPVSALTLGKGDSKPKVDYSKCVRCMCCHEFCPHQAIIVHKSLLAKLILK
ncbi:MAG: DUF362 domain-containing protein [Candidatus Cloacimonetes bacterium]|nr:DUF362 domain-containing protein [Candidatus Cloacimonadota bacterium]